MTERWELNEWNLATSKNIKIKTIWEWKKKSNYWVNQKLNQANVSLITNYQFNYCSESKKKS